MTDGFVGSSHAAWEAARLVPSSHGAPGSLIGGQCCVRVGGGLDLVDVEGMREVDERQTASPKGHPSGKKWSGGDRRDRDPVMRPTTSRIAIGGGCAGWPISLTLPCISALEWTVEGGGCTGSGTQETRRKRTPRSTLIPYLRLRTAQPSPASCFRMLGREAVLRVHGIAISPGGPAQVSPPPPVGQHRGPDGRTIARHSRSSQETGLRAYPIVCQDMYEYAGPL